jgi:hypothetical protein
MLLLTKDLFARMAISAQKNRSLNTSFKVVHADKWDKYPVDFSSSNEIQQKLSRDSSSKFELNNFENDANINRKNIPNTIESNSSINAISNSKINFIKDSSTGRIEDKVNKIIDNPHLLQIKAELEFAEALLKKIKVMDEHNIKIPVIEETIFRLKRQLEQKTYV